jgi:predicted amidohydrolase
MAKRVNLIAVQARPELKDYRDPEAFYRKMAGLASRAVAEVDTALPTLIAFPEAIGLYLSFVPFYYESIKDCKTLKAAMARILSRNIWKFVRAAIKYRTFGISTFFLSTALEAERIYSETFSTLAREHGVYLLAGSIFLPQIEQEAAKGRFVARSGVRNISYLYSPTGKCLYRTPKVNLVPGQETGIFEAGSCSELLPVETSLGRIGTLICYDGFHQSLIERYDALGVEIVVKPSYNTHHWNSPWSFDKNIKEGQAWMRNGVTSLIQDCENIKYGVNPMMVGRIFDLDAEGLSTIAINRNLREATAETDILAIATNPAEEEIVTATVEI